MGAQFAQTSDQFTLIYINLHQFKSIYVRFGQNYNNKYKMTKWKCGTNAEVIRSQSCNYMSVQRHVMLTPNVGAQARKYEMYMKSECATYENNVAQHIHKMWILN